MDLRRAPKVSAGVRIIDVEGFDLTPCGGTHVHAYRANRTVARRASRTLQGQAARLVSRGAARPRGRAREGRVLVVARGETHVRRRSTSAAPSRKLQNDFKQRTDALANARGELFELLAKSILERTPPSPTGTTSFASRAPTATSRCSRRSRVKLASARADVVAICTAPDGDGVLVVVQRGASDLRLRRMAEGARREDRRPRRWTPRARRRPRAERRHDRIVCLSR